MRHPRSTKKPAATAGRAHEVLVARRKAARRGVPRLNPATKQKSKDYR